MSGELNLRPDHDDLQDAKIRELEKTIQPKQGPPMDD
jgi:hypothetical protein